MVGTGAGTLGGILVLFYFILPRRFEVTEDAIVIVLGVRFVVFVSGRFERIARNTRATTLMSSLDSTEVPPCVDGAFRLKTSSWFGQTTISAPVLMP
jgi:hypothetical protein